MQIWEVVIYLTSSCQLIVCESVAKSGGGALFGWSINATAVTSWRLFCKIYGNNITLLKLLRELVLQTLGKYGRNRPGQSLNTSAVAWTSIKLDTINHAVVKDGSKYCGCQQCGRSILFKCEKCKVSLHP